MSGPKDCIIFMPVFAARKTDPKSVRDEQKTRTRKTKRIDENFVTNFYFVALIDVVGFLFRGGFFFPTLDAGRAYARFISSSRVISGVLTVSRLKRKIIIKIK